MYLPVVKLFFRSHETWSVNHIPTSSKKRFKHKKVVSTSVLHTCTLKHLNTLTLEVPLLIQDLSGKH